MQEKKQKNSGLGVQLSGRAVLSMDNALDLISSTGGEKEKRI
jgi:hypothetical protein